MATRSAANAPRYDTLEAFAERWADAFRDSALVRRADGTIVPREPSDSIARATAQVDTLPPVALADAAVPAEGGGVGGLELGEVIGHGGMGVVRRARQRELHRDVAVKSPRRESEPEATSSLLREARATGALEHPNVVPVHSLARGAGGEPLMVMKEIRGVAWSELLSAKQHELLPDEAAARRRWHLGVFEQVCNAVRYAHAKGIIHRDLKPDNVMIGDFGEVYVVDWGLAVAADDAEIDLPRARDVANLAGTPAYMAPEMAEPQLGLGRHTDVYLLGALLHTALTGCPRHQASSPMSQIFAAFHSEPVKYGASVPRELAAICNRATSRSPSDRFPSVEALREALVEAMQHGVSRELAAAAEQRRRKLASFILGDGGGDSVSLAQLNVQRLFVECRFGYEQALQDWPGNDEAKRGLRATLEVMVEYHLARGARADAAALLHEIDDPDADLVARLGEVKAREAAERVRIKRLETLRDSVDLRKGRRGRVITMLALAALWLVDNLTWALLERGGIFQAGYGTYLLKDAVYVASFVATAHLFLRNSVLVNRINRALYVILLSTMAMLGLVAAVRWWHGASFAQTLLIGQLLLAMAILPTALLITPRALGGSLLLLASYLVGTQLPGYHYEVVAVGGTLALIYVGLTIAPADEARTAAIDDRDDDSWSRGAG